MGLPLAAGTASAFFSVLGAGRRSSCPLTTFSGVGCTHEVAVVGVDVRLGDG